MFEAESAAGSRILQAQVYHLTVLFVRNRP